MYKQKEETRYANNEYENMPSIDYRYCENQKRFFTGYKHLVDWELVKSICNKYGFDYTTIDGTFCRVEIEGENGFGSEFIVYKKLDIDYKYYDELERSGRYDLLRKLKDDRMDMMLKLHDCVHELDEKTNLVFEIGWNGNCGTFGSHDIYRMTYSFGNSLFSWRYIIDRWHPSIHNTNAKLERGVYLMMTTRHLKR